MSTLYQTAYHVDMKNATQPGMNRNGQELEQVVHTVEHIIPEWLAEEGVGVENGMVWYGIVLFTSISVGSNPCSYLLTSATVRIPVHTATKSGTGTYPIRDDSLLKSTGCSFTPLQKSPRNQRFMLWFTCRPKSYPL